MTQLAVRNTEGMATSFPSTQLVNLRSTINFQMPHIYQKIQVGAIYEKLPLAFYQTQGRQRQISTIRALMVSPSYWEDLTGGAGLAITKQLNIYSLTSDFIANQDRFSRLIPRLSPRQERFDKVFEIKGFGSIGKVELGFAFSSIDVDGATPDTTYPSTGIVEFPPSDIGKIISIAYVTVPVYNIIKIIRTHEQPDGENTGVEHPPYAYVMHPSLAPTFGIPVPAV